MYPAQDLISSPTSANLQFAVPRTLTTSKKVDSSARAKDPGVRLFFRHFLIVHLTRRFYMDGYLGFMPPGTNAILICILNHKWTSIPSDVFRKGLKKSVRVGSA